MRDQLSGLELFLETVWNELCMSTHVKIDDVKTVTDSKLRPSDDESNALTIRPGGDSVNITRDIRALSVIVWGFFSRVRNLLSG